MGVGMNLKTLVASVTLGLTAGAASAASLSVVGGPNFVPFGSGNYDTDCTGGPTDCYNPTGPAAGLTNDLQAFNASTGYPGLVVDTAARLTVTFLGKEAAATNTAFSVAGGSVSTLDAIGSSYTTTIGPGTVDLSFSSSIGSFAGSQGFSSMAALAFGGLSADETSIYAYFDDSGASVDRDWDDMVVLVQVAEIPVPAAGLLILTALGGLAAMRRRKSTV